MHVTILQLRQERWTQLISCSIKFIALSNGSEHCLSSLCYPFLTTPQTYNNTDLIHLHALIHIKSSHVHLPVSVHCNVKSSKFHITCHYLCMEIAIQIFIFSYLSFCKHKPYKLGPMRHQCCLDGERHIHAHAYIHMQMDCTCKMINH